MKNILNNIAGFFYGIIMGLSIRGVIVAEGDTRNYFAVIGACALLLMINRLWNKLYKI